MKSSAHVTRASIALTEWTSQQLRQGRTYVEIETSFGIKAAVRRWCDGVNIPNGAARVLIERVANIPVSWWSELPEATPPDKQDSGPKQIDRLEKILLEILSAVRESNDLLGQILAPPTSSKSASNNNNRPSASQTDNSNGHKTGTP